MRLQNRVTGQISEAREYKQEAEIEREEKQHVFFRIARHQLAVCIQRYEAGERSYRSTQSSQIDRNEESRIVGRET